MPEYGTDPIRMLYLCADIACPAMMAMPVESRCFSSKLIHEQESVYTRVCEHKDTIPYIRTLSTFGRCVARRPDQDELLWTLEPELKDVVESSESCARNTESGVTLYPLSRGPHLSSVR